MEVKGSLLLSYVELIKANDDRDWQRWLTDDDRAIIDGLILSSAWYPYSTYRNISHALFKELAASNLDIAYDSGKNIMRNLVGVYQSLVVEGDPVRTLRGLASLKGVFMRGDYGAEVSEHSDGRLVYHWSPVEDEENEEAIKAYAYHLAGSVVELTEQTGAQNVDCKINSTGREYWIEIKWDCSPPENLGHSGAVK